MIALAKEQLIPLRDAPKYLPPRPNGKRLHISAIYRWVKCGVRGRVLESVTLGGTTYTSLEALQRFAEPINSTWRQPAPSHFGERSKAERTRRVTGELERELGVLIG